MEEEREAPIHFDLYSVLKELISEGLIINNITFKKIEPKLRLDSGGEADLVLIDKGENYYWEGNMDLFVPCTPAWNPKQHKIIE